LGKVERGSMGLVLCLFYVWEKEKKVFLGLVYKLGKREKKVSGA